MSNLNDIITDLSIKEHRPLWALVPDESDVDPGKQMYTGHNAYGTGPSQLSHPQGAFWDIYNDPSTRMTISPLELYKVDGGVLWELVEFYDSTSDRLKIVAVRRIDEPSKDEKFVTASSVALEACIGDPAKEALIRSSALDVWQKGYVADVIRSSDLPVARRLRDTLESYDHYRAQRSRLVLQNVLSELSLGKINGVSLEDLDELNEADFRRVLAAAIEAYPNSTASGALCYILKKKTDLDRYSRWYQSRAQSLNLDLNFFEPLIVAHRDAGLPAPKFEQVNFFDDVLRPLEHMDYIIKMAAASGRVVELRHLAMAFPEEYPASILEYAQSNARKLEEILSDSEVNSVDLTLGLLAAYSAGADPESATVIESFNKLPKPFRLICIRTKMQHAAHQTMMAAKK